MDIYTWFAPEIATTGAQFKPYGVLVPATDVPVGILQGDDPAPVLIPWNAISHIRATPTEFTDAGL